MAKRTKEEESEAEEKSSPSASPRDEDDARESDPPDDDEASDEDSSEEDDQKSAAAEPSDDSDDEDDADENDADENASDEGADEDTAAEDSADEDSADLAAEEGEDVVLPTQLGMQRYIFAAYFVGGMLVAYVIGRGVHGIWSHYSNRDFFVSAVPRLAAIPDETKQTYSTVLGALISLLFIVRTARKPDVRRWSEDVTTEMAKVKWPTRKEVTNSTIVVITASALATTYLFLLDRLWAFVTGLVYGAGT